MELERVTPIVPSLHSARSVADGIMNSDLLVTRRIGVPSSSKSNTEALWGSQGVFGPAAIDTLAKKKIIHI